MNTHNAYRTRLTVVVAVVAMGVAWVAGVKPAMADAAWERMAAAPDEQLEQMRGGFEIELGLKLSFGFERVSYINGALVSTQTVNVPDLPVASDGQLGKTLARASDLGLIQNGSGNTFILDSSAVLNANVIQNSADNQEIVTRTVINSTVNSLRLLRSINLQTVLQDGIVGSLRR